MLSDAARLANNKPWFSTPFHQAMPNMQSMNKRNTVKKWMPVVLICVRGMRRHMRWDTSCYLHSLHECAHTKAKANRFHTCCRPSRPDCRRTGSGNDMGTKYIHARVLMYNTRYNLFTCIWWKPPHTTGETTGVKCKRTACKGHSRQQCTRRARVAKGGALLSTHIARSHVTAWTCAYIDMLVLHIQMQRCRRKPTMFARKPSRNKAHAMGNVAMDATAAALKRPPRLRVTGLPQGPGLRKEQQQHAIISSHTARCLQL